MELGPGKLLTKNKTMISRQIMGETILVPIRLDTGDMECIYTLNETAARAWELMDGTHSLEEIHLHIIDEYDIEPDAAWHDLATLADQLQEIRAVLVN